MKNAVIYARCCASGQSEEMIEGQIRECRDYAKANDMNIVGVYVDYPNSASKDTKNRVQRNKMMLDSEKNLFEVIVVSSLDRLTRSSADFATLSEQLKKNGVKLVPATEPYDEFSIESILENLLASCSAK